MGGIAIVRPALNVLGFSSGNVSLFIMTSFSPFNWTCLQREEAIRCVNSVSYNMLKSHNQIYRPSYIPSLLPLPSDK